MQRWRGVLIEAFAPRPHRTARLTGMVGESPSLTGEIGETGPERQVAGEAQQDTISCRGRG